jgi:hypothetical protein
MTIHDPDRERGFLRADTGGAMMLGRSLDEARAERGITPWALSCFGLMVSAALCELDEEAGALLQRAHDWLEVAIHEDERPNNEIERERDYTETRRFHVLGLGY